MHIVTVDIYPDEECYGLAEGPHMWPSSEGGQQWRWTQKVFVIRGDAIAKWETDIGPVGDYGRIQPIIIPSFGENTVAQLQDLAVKNRQDTYWDDRSEALLSESTLIEDHLRQLDQHREVIANRSTFGPSGGHQRNGYSRKAARELYGRS